MEQLLEWDRQLLLFFNGLHNPVIDELMFYLTKQFAWLPLYLLLLYVTIKEKKARSWMVLFAMALVIAMADRITSGFFKPFFERLRPSHEPSLAGMVHLVHDYKGGLYGFCSGHAANTFATATFFVLLLSQRFPPMRWLFLWAALVSYTRIYLGVHYPGDVLVGAAIGVGCGMLGYKVFKRLEQVVGASRHGQR